jgi:hypothetical protein
MTEGERRRQAAATRRYLARIKAEDPERWAKHLARLAKKNKRWHARHPEWSDNYYAKNRARILAQLERRRRMRGVPTRAERSAAIAKAKAERRAEREAERAALAEQRREARRAYGRAYAKRYRAIDPDRKREQDRRYRAANKAKVLALGKILKQRARARGYRWKPTPEYLARQQDRSRAENVKMTAAHRYLISVGLAESRGPSETSYDRRVAALRYARQLGIV